MDMVQDLDTVQEYRLKTNIVIFTFLCKACSGIGYYFYPAMEREVGICHPPSLERRTRETMGHSPGVHLSGISHEDLDGYISLLLYTCHYEFSDVGVSLYPAQQLHQGSKACHHTPHLEDLEGCLSSSLLCLAAEIRIVWTPF